MIFRSNLRCPDLTPHFPHLDVRPMRHSYGHSVASDWADKAADDPVFGIYKNCGLLTHDEAAILWNIAERTQGFWLDIGSHTGWTAAHIASGTRRMVLGIDPMYGVPEFKERAESNTQAFPVYYRNFTSRVFFEAFQDIRFSGVMIDGDHTEGEPLLDAKGALARLNREGVIVFHDFIGKPVREAVSYLIDQGFDYRIYWTPHVMACCWRGNFIAPKHYGDPRLLIELPRAMPDFDFTRQGLCA